MDNVLFDLLQSPKFFSCCGIQPCLFNSSQVMLSSPHQFCLGNHIALIILAGKL